MRFAVGGDERNEVTDFVLDELRARGHDVVLTVGPVGGRDEQWADCGRSVAEADPPGEADNGVVFCWTGTGVSMAANKVAGARAALCTDGEQARGARRWNDANVLAMSLRLTSRQLAKEIIDSWLSNDEIDPAEAANIDKVKSADASR